DNAAAAIKDAKAAAAQKAIDEARARGARGELNPTVRAGRAAAKDIHTGEEILMGAVVEAVVTER
ncbi:MAG: hypothetical protein HUJ65_07060, partial [Oscillospiraceae bacterium]|nr:hypothetical protein [Oscillospiraceae bacterium]